MRDNVDRHNEMVDYITQKTGLAREKVQRILYAGEPWVEADRFSALFYKAFQYAEHSGTGPGIPLQALASLMKLDLKGNRSEDTENQGAEGSTEFQQKIERVATVAREPYETVQNVVQTMIDYFYRLVEKSYKEKEEGEK
jgi:hypothetical protein